jgi:non-homologous end joining protein Ku
MATTIWKGHIAFGLVSFPVRLQAAARSQAVSFNQLQSASPMRSLARQAGSLLPGRG